MATPLGTTFSTDEQVVVQGDVTCMGKTVESLVREFDQAKYEEFLSSGSKSPKARVYRKVSSWVCSQVRFEILSDTIGEKDVWLIASCVMSRPASQNARKRSRDESRRRIYARKIPHVYTLSLN